MVDNGDRTNDGTDWGTSKFGVSYRLETMRLTKETVLVWNYQFADPDFGFCQAKELMEHLESVLTNDPLSVKTGQQLDEVKPQVSSNSL